MQTHRLNQADTEAQTKSETEPEPESIPGIENEAETVQMHAETQ